MHKLMRYIKGYERQALLAPLFKMLEACFELFVPLVIASIIDTGIKNQDAAFIWTRCGLLVLLAAIGLAEGAGLWFAMRSLLECLGSIYLTLLVIGGITTATEWHRIHATTAQKLVYTLTFPLFMLTYLPISLAALFMKVEWKPIHHSVNLSSLPYPAAKN